jgi:hypothetical protein
MVGYPANLCSQNRLGYDNPVQNAHAARGGAVTCRVDSTPVASGLLAAGMPGVSVHAVRPWSATVYTPVRFPEARPRRPWVY